MKLFNILKPACHIKKLHAKQVDIAYKKHRYMNFAGIFIGYACYYLLRKNFSLAMPFLLNTGFTKSQLGLVLSAIPISYGISKFLMGNLSDRSNPRYFIATGLVISVIVNLVFGCIPGVTASLYFMIALMFINGWAQGMGAPPCYRTVAHWFSISERGRVMSVWNISHNLGAGLLGALAMLIIPLFTWKSVFYLPSIIVLLFTILIVILMRDTPQSVGLMPIEEYRNEYPEINTKDREKELSAKEILFKYVLVNKYIWFLALANVFVYFVRYGVLDWAPTYLTEMKGLNSSKSGVTFIIYEAAGILGMLLCGYMSDKMFKGRRAPVSILCMIIVFFGVLLYWFSPYMIFNHIALLLIGMFIYGPIMLVGIQVLDIMPKKAVGTAIGLLGFFASGGNILASAGFGYLVEYFGWQGGFIVLIVACVLATLLFSLTLRIRKATHRKEEAPSEIQPVLELEGET
ncbi:MAG TPA: glycerol-3-phosphate transporter [Coxiellaceae bacterium]|nr:glycerol-3-phosphate transporter [Coxiellaceae bacterium]HBS52145.1 glycerol-3-phosphate transporter [Coxiellaceae bacterium]HBY56168.1 glycerol-3-phosphate transporter [Coxiellaceae bacterium]